MSRFIIVVIIINIIITSITTPCAAGESVARVDDGPTGTLGGVVLEQATGNVLPGAHIIVTETGDAAASAPDGRFQLPGQPT